MCVETYLPDEAFRPDLRCGQGTRRSRCSSIPSIRPGGTARRDYELTVVAGYLFDSTINIFRMICSHFLDRYQGMKLVCAHTARFSLLLRNRMQREGRHQRDAVWYSAAQSRRLSA
jgi:hypothetical protein